MTENQQPYPHDPNVPYEPPAPSRRDRLRPLELVGFAAVLAIFAGLIVLLVLRTDDGIPDFAFAGIAAGIVFIVVALVVALLGLGGKPSDEDIEARKSLQDPNADGKQNWH